MGLVSDRFYSVSEAWAASRRTDREVGTLFQGHIRRYGPPAGQQRAPTWRPSAPAIGAPAGGHALVQVPTQLRETILDMVAKAAPVVADAYDRHMGAFALDVFTQWPVKSGYSKAALALDYRVDGDRFIGSLSNTAPYLFYIKGHPHRRLINRPALGVVQAIGNEVIAKLGDVR